MNRQLAGWFGMLALLVLCTSAIFNSGGGSSPTAEEYFISSTGDDGDDGLTAMTAWKTIARANDVAPSRDGHVLIRIGAGTYTADEHLRPSVGGRNWDHTIKYCADGGDVTLRGTGVDFVNTFEDGVSFVTVDYDCPDAANTITLDGQCTPVRGEESTGCGIRQGTQVHGQDLKLCYETINTYGYTGFGIYKENANRVTFCGSSTGPHGTPVWGESDDWGDFLYFNQEIAVGNRFLIDGGTTGIDLNLGGHAIHEGQGAAITMRNVRMNNLWAGRVSGFSGTDGNRAAIFGSRSATDNVVHDVLVNRTGKAPDSAYQESFKCEGQRTGIFDSVFRNPHAYFMLASSGEHSTYAEDCHVSHTVFDNGGPIAVIEDYCDAYEGDRRVHGYKFKNIVAKNVARAWNPRYPNLLFVIFDRCGDSYPPTAELLEVDGLSVQDSDCSRLGVYIESVGVIKMADALDDYPDMFKNYTCASDLDLDNAPANGTDLTLSNMLMAYTPVSDTESIDQGVALTTANGAGRSSTTLSVHDGCYFPDPVWGTPGRGQSSGGYKVNIEGVGDVAITAKTLTGTPGTSTACRANFTISPASTWANGADVNFPFAGAAPDRGLTH